MFVIGDIVVYGIHGVCTVIAEEMRTIDKKQVCYLVLEPVCSATSKFYIPTHNEKALSKLQKVLGKEQLLALLHSPQIRQDHWIEDENQRKQYYRELVNAPQREKLLQMVYSIQLSRKRMTQAGKRLHICDENFLKEAQKALSTEFSVVLGMPISQVLEFLEKELEIV